MRNVSQSEHRHIRGYLYESRLLYRISHMQDSGLNARVWELSSQPYSLICYIHHIPGMIFYVSGFLFFKLIIIYRVRGVWDEHPRTITIQPSYLEIFNSLMVFPLRAPELYNAFTLTSSMRITVTAYPRSPLKVKRAWWCRCWCWSGGGFGFVLSSMGCCYHCCFYWWWIWSRRCFFLKGWWWGG